MEDQLLSTREAAEQLGITVTTLYDWLGQSDRGLLVIRGQQTFIEYFQGGANGQGRIRIATSELERIKGLMRVRPCLALIRKAPLKNCVYPGITVPLGRPPPC